MTNTLTGLYNPLPSATLTAVGHAHTTAHNSIQVTVKLITCTQSTVRGQLLVSLKKNNPTFESILLLIKSLLCISKNLSWFWCCLFEGIKIPIVIQPQNRFKTTSEAKVDSVSYDIIDQFWLCHHIKLIHQWNLL